MRAAMIDAMKFWVAEKDIDGFRCDVAHNVPADFWQKAVEELHEVKDVFMLAEAQKASIAPAFDMSYGWDFHHIFGKLLKGEATMGDFKTYVDDFDKDFSPEHYTLMFTTNHDENAWAGPINERYGDAARAFDIIAFTFDGMPLIYSGQEAGLDKRLEFFRKDNIIWKDYPLQGFYTQLLQLKKNNPALFNGTYGGKVKIIDTKENENLFMYSRSEGWNEVVVAVNLGKEEASFKLPFKENGSHELAMGEISLDENAVRLPAYGFAIWTSGKE